MPDFTAVPGAIPRSLSSLPGLQLTPNTFFSGEYDKWDEADNFLRAFVLGRNMGYLIAPEFLKFYEKKHLKCSWNLAKVY